MIKGLYNGALILELVENDPKFPPVDIILVLNEDKNNDIILEEHF